MSKRKNSDAVAKFEKNILGPCDLFLHPYAGQSCLSVTDERVFSVTVRITHIKVVFRETRLILTNNVCNLCSRPASYICIQPLIGCLLALFCTIFQRLADTCVCVSRRTHYSTFSEIKNQTNCHESILTAAAGWKLRLH